MDVVFTEDSDLLAFGCTHVFFKMDNLGNGDYINLENLNEVKTFENYKDDMFLTACILSGCDYLESVKGVGLKKAVKLVSEHTEDTVQECFKTLKSDSKVEWPRKFEKKFLKAFLTFKFQRVWCPEQ